MKLVMTTARLLVLSAVLISGCGEDDAARQLRQYGFLHFKVAVEQNGLIKQAEGGQISLERKPFTIRFSFIENDSIFVNASFGSSAYDAAAAGKSIEEVPGFNDAAISEEPFNREEVLSVSSKLPNFWYYAGDGEHRFSSIAKNSGLYVCDRVVSRIKDTDSGGDPVEIAKLKQGGLFLVFAQLKWSDDYTKKIEYKRDYLKIVFTDTK